MSTERNLLMWIEKDIKDPGIKDIFDTLSFLWASSALIIMGGKIFPSHQSIIHATTLHDWLFVVFCIFSGIIIVSIAGFLAYATLFRFMILFMNLIMSNDPEADFALRLNRSTWQFIRDYPKYFLGSIALLLTTIPSFIILFSKIIATAIAHK